jgi:hypothetical protein
MDKVPQLGKLITEPQHRDAIHIAVAPVIAGMEMYAGDHIGFTDSGDAYTVVTDAEKLIGIVDPFLREKCVYPGEQFYMFLYPNTITSLRHEWTHPEFEKEEALAELEPTLYKLKGAVAEEKWISDFADSIGSNFNELMQGAEDYLKHGDYLVRGGVFEGYSIPDEFWDKYEIIKRIRIEENDRGTFLSCSC